MCVENPSVGGVPNEERIRIAFRVLDDLVPKLGVYTRIFTKIKDDLFGILSVKFSPHKKYYFMKA